MSGTCESQTDPLGLLWPDEPKDDAWRHRATARSVIGPMAVIALLAALSQFARPATMLVMAVAGVCWAVVLLFGDPASMNPRPRILVILGAVLGTAVACGLLTLPGVRQAVNGTGALAGPMASAVDLRGAGDLSGRDLRGRSLNGIDLSARNLSGADLRGASLRGANLTRANLRGAKITGADLSGADLSQSCLVDVVLTQATLSGVLTVGAVTVLPAQTVSAQTVPAITAGASPSSPEGPVSPSISPGSAPTQTTSAVADVCGGA